MFFERCLCGSRLLKWKNAVDVHFEWACLDQLIQSINCLAATFAIVRVDQPASQVRSAAAATSRSRTPCGAVTGVDMRVSLRSAPARSGAARTAPAPRPRGHGRGDTPVRQPSW